MQPLDIVLWAAAFMIACIPVAIGCVIIGVTVIELRKKLK
jgi:hypothetical protein